MRTLIEQFPEQLKKALEIGKNQFFKTEKHPVNNIVICGLGGSGIGANFFHDAVYEELEIPLTICKGYFIPTWLSKDSLVVICSYSGNTEEVLHCFDQAIARNATIIGISSNGEVQKMCEENRLNFVKIPGGFPPRACLGYSVVQLFYIALYFQLINKEFEIEFEASISLLLQEQDKIMKEAKKIAENIYDKIPIIYSSDAYESVSVRWRQQINENGKQLCWHHVVPEMNHNELVGWRDKNEMLAVIFLRNETDYFQIKKRMDLNKEVYKKYTPNIYEVHSKGNSFIERGLYLIHIGDWLSLFLSELRGYDTTEVKVIDHLKSNLKS